MVRVRVRVRGRVRARVRARVGARARARGRARLRFRSVLTSEERLRRAAVGARLVRGRRARGHG
jgi:hypothetical protein